jgi:hypothetical protein
MFSWGRAWPSLFEWRIKWVLHQFVVTEQVPPPRPSVPTASVKWRLPLIHQASFCSQSWGNQHIKDDTNPHLGPCAVYFSYIASAMSMYFNVHTNHSGQVTNNLLPASVTSPARYRYTFSVLWFYPWIIMHLLWTQGLCPCIFWKMRGTFAVSLTPSSVDY